MKVLVVCLAQGPHWTEVWYVLVLVGPTQGDSRDSLCLGSSVT